MIAIIVSATGVSLEWWHVALMVVLAVAAGVGAFVWLRWMDARDRALWASQMEVSRGSDQ